MALSAAMIVPSLLINPAAQFTPIVTPGMARLQLPRDLELAVNSALDLDQWGSDGSARL
jgi:hypothetical protein